MNHIKDLSTDLQCAQPSDLVFYNITTDKAENLFYERLEKSEVKTLILNRALKKNIDQEVIVIDKDQWKELQTELCDKVYPKSDKTKIVGITGTNGKTSCSYIISSILRMNEKTTCVIGTNGILVNDKEENSTSINTSPSYIGLRKIIHDYQDEAEFFIIEVSSHALYQDRYHELMFEVCGWTNLTQDHLDYHGSMEEYQKAKELIGQKIKKNSYCFFPTDQSELFSKITLNNKKICTPIDIKNLPPFFQLEHNKSNFELSFNIAKYLLAKEPKLNFEEFNYPKGRFECFEKGSNLYVVDYAHTPDALENILRSIKKSFHGKKLISVFGCGGDRDNKKRPMMGEISTRIADYSIITSDNPRTEEPEKIIADITKGLGGNFKIVVDRKEAIKEALLMARENTIVIVAGKGHETYQEINNQRHDFDDLKTIKELLNELD
ncbi:MAG: UDP-N-acetylmuramoyl-L-alanyl-D-glutamate--2,6-diaminopimelate ligase [Oligoflexia bacterium]|nr:UDP-N-acetylmuramoyl-L-alanyl-D-glutamate--2,6-diaminopimelate ligase [Oligoflexia bacterium]